MADERRFSQKEVVDILASFLEKTAAAEPAAAPPAALELPPNLPPAALEAAGTLMAAATGGVFMGSLMDLVGSMIGEDPHRLLDPAMYSDPAFIAGLLSVTGVAVSGGMYVAHEWEEGDMVGAGTAAVMELGAVLAPFTIGVVHPDYERALTGPFLALSGPMLAILHGAGGHRHPFT